MADTSTNDETANQGDSQTTVTTTSDPASTQDNAGAAEVERLRKEAEQKELRIRQLENEAATRKKAEDDARQKQLEEDGKFKDLYEKEKTERENLVRERETAERQTTLSKATEQALSEFPDSVKEIAKTAGLTLSDDTDQAKADFKTKLEAISKNVTGGNKVRGTNQGTVVDVQPEQKELLTKMRFDNPAIRKEAVHKAVSGLSGISEMRKMAGVQASEQ